MGDNFFNNFFGQTGVNSPFHKPPFTGNFNPGGNMNGEARSENGQHNRNTNDRFETAFVFHFAEPSRDLRGLQHFNMESGY